MTVAPVHPRAGGERAEKAARASAQDGSSPRGRGTRAQGRRVRGQGRFIPARAGNANGRSIRVLVPSVHPRAGGERRLETAAIIPHLRFIPARAGNARTDGLGRRQSPVHPRAGGERTRRCSTRFAVLGSSPRGRGTRSPDERDCPEHRFIPARAGNALYISSTFVNTPVHPRAGGERIRCAPASAPRLGSSPRGRGTLTRTASPTGIFRFIPARAGNAVSVATPDSSSTVHPRAGGERPHCEQVSSFIVRSSPRGRGTHLAGRAGGLADRFIPARAGNASSSSWIAVLATVHPRAGGERASKRAIRAIQAGSSPRGRGTPGVPSAFRDAGRFIPARAGNARSDRGRRRTRTVHPRAGGERDVMDFILVTAAGSSPRGRGTRGESPRAVPSHRFVPARAGNASAATSPAIVAVGSSPRGRGTHVRPDRPGGLRRFIPARAGNATPTKTACGTSSVHPRPRAGNALYGERGRWAFPVHPRAGGERRISVTRCPTHSGSSPRGRGTRPASVRKNSKRRFIPARAGNAGASASASSTTPVHPRAGGERPEHGRTSHR